MLEQKVFWYILDRYKTVEGRERPGCCVEDDTGHVDFVRCNCILMVFCVLSMLSMICSKGSIDSEKKDLKRWNDLHDVRMTRVPVSPVSPAQAHCWWYPGPGLELDTALDMTTLNCTAVSSCGSNMQCKMVAYCIIVSMWNHLFWVLKECKMALLLWKAGEELPHMTGA